LLIIEHFIVFIIVGIFDIFGLPHGTQGLPRVKLGR
jgi:hypothetical protein